MEEWQKKDQPSIVVEAVRLNEDNVAEVAAWCRGALIEETDPIDPLEKQYGINIQVPTGMKRASLGMYVIKFGRSFFVSHNRQFELVYTPKHRDSPPPESAGDARRALGFSDPFDQGRFS